MTDVKDESGEKNTSPDILRRQKQAEAEAVNATDAPLHKIEGGAHASAHFSVQPNSASFPSHVQASKAGDGQAYSQLNMDHVTLESEATHLVAAAPLGAASRQDTSPLEKLATIISSSEDIRVAPAVPSAEVQPSPIQVAVSDRPAAPQAPVVDAPAKPGFWARRKQRKAQLAAYARQTPRTARDKRWARRRRRLWLEELLGWIFVPIILIGIYWAIIGIFALMGTTPEAVIAGIRQVLGSR